MGQTNCVCNKSFKKTEEIVIIDSHILKVTPEISQTLIKVQSSFRGFTIRKRYKEILQKKVQFLQKRASLNQNVKFQESWDLYFSKNKIEFSIIKLNQIKEDIISFYNTFLNIPEDPITIFEQNHYHIDVDNFLNTFKIPVLRYVSQFFEFGLLNKELSRISTNINNDIPVTFIENVEEESEKSVILNLNDNDSKDVNDDNEISTFRSEMQLMNNSNNNNNVEVSRKSVQETSFFKKIFRILNFVKEKEVENNLSTINTPPKNQNNNKTLFKKCNTMRSQKGLIKKTLNHSVINDKRINKKSGELKQIPSKSIGFLREKCQIFSNRTDLQLSHNNNNTSKFPITLLEEIITLIEKESQKTEVITFYDALTSQFYEGNWDYENNTRKGLGFTYMIDKSKGKRYKYLGYYLNDQYHGIGIFIREDGYSYCGEFREGRKSGFGIEITSDNAEYRGLFYKDKYCGFGQFSFNNNHFVGCFNNGIKDNLGFSKFEDNSTYCGMFKKNLMNGEGLFKWKEGHTYQGSWKNDQMHGIGRYIWKKGDIYHGSYENDQRHGQGEYIFSNGSVLRGAWINSKKEGKFTLFDGEHTFKIYYRNDIQVE